MGRSILRENGKQAFQNKYVSEIIWNGSLTLTKKDRDNLEK